MIEIENFADDHLINLFPKDVVLFGANQVYQYEVEEPKFLISDNKSIKIEIKLARQLHFIVLTNFLPIILINVVRLK